MNRFVLDCSVAMSWCYEDKADARADLLLQSMSSAIACVPCVWALEVANVLLVGECRGRLTEADVSGFLTRVRAMSIEQEPALDSERANAVLSLARRYGLSAYDAAYLELAIRLDVPLATLDSKLLEAAKSAGVSLAL